MNDEVIETEMIVEDVNFELEEASTLNPEKIEIDKQLVDSFPVDPSEDEENVCISCQ